jgi:flagellar hook-basal body complex protein FliE
VLIGPDFDKPGAIVTGWNLPLMHSITDHKREAVVEIGAIDKGRIEAMIAQLRAAASKPTGIDGPIPLQGEAPAPKVNFADALRSSLDNVNNSMVKADELGKAFTLGDDNVNLSDVMIAAQKANISFQATLQVRNKLVSAYHEIMNMQV